jgi:crotonobetainyl-CoA:carnitine CoA-transferase CaiB-like acyl-CoA transferase
MPRTPVVAHRSSVAGVVGEVDEQNKGGAALDVDREEQALTRGPLDGVVVVEVATYVSLPFAGLQLAELGATVIKVEAPAGDPYRRFGRPDTYVSAQFASLNRGKQSVTLDLKSDDGRRKLLELIRTADVYLANWRRGVDDALGLGDAVLEACNPRLIRVAVTGFGPDGPSADEPAFDTAVQARSGMMDAFSPTDVPVVVPGFPMDKSTAFIATQAVLAALYARERTGLGEHIDIAMLDVASAVNFPDLFPARVFLDHQPEDPRNRHTMALRPIRASDGYVMVAPGGKQQIIATFAAVERADWANDVLAQPSQVDLVTTMYARLDDVSSSWTVNELMARFRAAGVPAAPCVRMDEHFDDEQVVHNQLYEIVAWPDVGPTRVVRYPAAFRQWPRLVAKSAPPKLGEHNAAFGIDVDESGS